MIGNTAMGKRWAKRGAASMAFALVALTGAATPAVAAVVDPTPNVPVICDRGTTYLDFTTTTSTRTVTHDRYVSVPAGGSVDVTTNVTKIGTITASVKVTSSASVSAKTVMAEFSGTVGVELAASGSVTLQSSETVNFHMGPGQYAVFHGEKKFTGNWNGTQCNTNGTAENPLSGSAISWAVPAEGAASCSGSYSSTSFEYKAKAYAC